MLTFTIAGLVVTRGGNTEATDYTGPRVADGIVSYLTKQAGAATKNMVTSEEIKQLVAENDVVVVRHLLFVRTGSVWPSREPTNWE